jgi:hypothetical protein
MYEPKTGEDKEVVMESLEPKGIMDPSESSATSPPANDEQLPEPQEKTSLAAQQEAVTALAQVKDGLKSASTGGPVAYVSLEEEVADYGDEGYLEEKAAAEATIESDRKYEDWNLAEQRLDAALRALRDAAHVLVHDQKVDAETSYFYALAQKTYSQANLDYEQAKLEWLTANVVGFSAEVAAGSLGTGGGWVRLRRPKTGWRTCREGRAAAAKVRSRRKDSGGVETRHHGDPRINERTTAGYLARTGTRPGFGSVYQAGGNHFQFVLRPRN